MEKLNTLYITLILGVHIEHAGNNYQWFNIGKSISCRELIMESIHNVISVCIKTYILNLKILHYTCDNNIVIEHINLKKKNNIYTRWLH